MDQEQTPQGGKHVPVNKKNYPQPAMGIRLQLKGELWLDHFAVMEQLHISRKSLERYCKKYGLKSSRIGQRRYFSETALLKLLKDNEQTGGRGKV